MWVTLVIAGLCIGDFKKTLLLVSFGGTFEIWGEYNFEERENKQVGDLTVHANVYDVLTVTTTTVNCTLFVQDTTSHTGRNDRVRAFGGTGITYTSTNT